jgi:hypothetical protein
MWMTTSDIYITVDRSLTVEDLAIIYPVFRPFAASSFSGCVQFRLEQYIYFAIPTFMITIDAGIYGYRDPRSHSESMGFSYTGPSIYRRCV